MYQKTINLSPTETLSIEWERKYTNLNIRKNGALIGSIQDPNELKTGRRFSLPEGGEIMVLVTNNGLELWHNGKELVSGLTSGKADDYGMAYKALAIFGSLQLVIVVLVLLLSHDINPWIMIGVSVSGPVLIGLSAWAWRSGSKVPFQIAMVVCVLNIVLPLLSIRLIWGVLIYYLYKGTQAEPLHIAPTKQVDMDGPLDSGI